MRRAMNPTQAQRDRDEGLSRARRLTWWAAAAAVGVTAAGAAIAANTIPGHTLDQNPAPAASSGSPAGTTDNSSAGSTGSPNGTAPGSSVTAPNAPNPQDQQPVVVSGGS
ncbi:MAG: hypothetical protein JOY80_05870 [Candidatus Dormibacteraeota bacterium]|nr:hypothetical protein [Candidatus Dormibacteraeota bacterium]